MDQVLIVFGYVEDGFNEETLFNNLSESLKSVSSDVIAKLSSTLKLDNVAFNPEFGRSLEVDSSIRILYMPTIEQFRNAFYKILQNSVQENSGENEELKPSKVTVIYSGQLIGLTNDWILSDSSFNGEQLISWLDGNSAKAWLSILNMIVEKRTDSPVEIIFVTPECGPKTGWPISKTAGSNLVSDFSTFVGKQRLATKLYIEKPGKIFGNPKPDVEDCKNLATNLLKGVEKISKLSKETVALRNRQDCINESVRSMKSSVPTLYMFPVGDYSMNSGLSLFSVDNINVIINGAHSSIDKAPQSWPLISVMNLIDSVILPDWSSNNIVFQRFLRSAASKKDGTRFGPLLVAPISSNEISPSPLSLNPFVEISQDDFQMNFVNNSPGDNAQPKCQLFYCIGAGELYLQPLSLKAGLVLVWKNKKKIVRILYPNNQLLPAGTSPASCLMRLVKSLSQNSRLLCSLDGSETNLTTPSTSATKTTTSRPMTGVKKTEPSSRPQPSSRPTTTASSKTSTSGPTTTTTRPKTATTATTKPITSNGNTRPVVASRQTTVGSTGKSTSSTTLSSKSSSVAGKPTTPTRKTSTTGVKSTTVNKATVAPTKTTNPVKPLSTTAKVNGTAGSANKKSTVTNNPAVPVTPAVKKTSDNKKPIDVKPKGTNGNIKTINSTLPAGIPTNIPPSRNNKDGVSSSILEELVAVGSDVKPFIPGQDYVASPVECDTKPTADLVITNGALTKTEPPTSKTEVGEVITKTSEITEEKSIAADEKNETAKLIDEKLTEEKSTVNALETCQNINDTKSTDEKLTEEKPIAKLLETCQNKIETKPTDIIEDKKDTTPVLNGLTEHPVETKLMNGNNHSSEETQGNDETIDDKKMLNPHHNDVKAVTMSHPEVIPDDDSLVTSNDDNQHQEKNILDIPSVGEMEQVKIITQDDSKLVDDLEDSIEDNDDVIDHKISDSQMNDSLDGIEDETDQIPAVTSTTNSAMEVVTEGKNITSVIDQSSKKIESLNPFEMTPMNETTKTNKQELINLGIYEDEITNGQDEIKDSSANLGPIHVQADNLLTIDNTHNQNNNNTFGNNYLDSPNSEASINSVVNMQQNSGNPSPNIGFENLNSSENKHMTPLSSTDSTKMPTDKDAFDNLLKNTSMVQANGVDKLSTQASYPQNVNFFDNNKESIQTPVVNNGKNHLDSQTSLGFEAFDESDGPKSLPPPTSKSKPSTGSGIPKRQPGGDSGAKTGSTIKGPSSTSQIGTGPTQLTSPLPQTMFLEVAWVPGYAAECPLSLVEDYFKVVRAKIYILSGEALHPNIGEALLKSKASWDPKMTEKWLASSSPTDVIEKIKVLATDEPPNWIRWLRTPSKLSGGANEEDMVTGEQRLIDAGFEVPPAANLCDIQLSSGDEKIITPGCRFEL